MMGKRIVKNGKETEEWEGSREYMSSRDRNGSESMTRRRKQSQEAENCMASRDNGSNSKTKTGRKKSQECGKKAESGRAKKPRMRWQESQNEMNWGEESKTSMQKNRVKNGK